MKNKAIALIEIGALVSSCQTAPKVVAELSENFSARSADSVKIFTMTDTVPLSARIIKKTAESGGNGFHIDEHKYPGFHGSTCHRVFGTMYLIPDSLITTDTRIALQNLEMYEEDVVQTKASQMITNIRDRRLNNPKDILKVSAGPSWIISEIQTYRKTYKSKSGFAFSADYQHIWGSGLGIGFNFMYFGTSFEPDGFDVDMYYCGPSIVGSLSQIRPKVAMGFFSRRGILGIHGKDNPRPQWHNTVREKSGGVVPDMHRIFVVEARGHRSVDELIHDDTE